MESCTARQAAKVLNIRRGAGFQPAGTPVLPARGLLHARRSSRNRREPNQLWESDLERKLLAFCLACSALRLTHSTDRLAQ